MQIQRSTPLVNQVATLLRQRIYSRTYPPGERMPSESELAQELKVSRTTVRTVLAKFASEGLIFRKQGDGTYVNKHVREIDMQYGGIWDFSKLIQGNGYHPHIQTVSLVGRPAVKEEAKVLEIDLMDNIVSMSRLFCADEQPVIYATNVFPKSLLMVDVAELDGNLPIHMIVQTYFEDQIAYVVSDIEATLAEESTQKTLYRERGFPLLKLRETFYSQDHRPLILGTSYFDFTVLKLRLVQAWGK